MGVYIREFSLQPEEVVLAEISTFEAGSCNENNFAEKDDGVTVAKVADSTAESATLLLPLYLILIMVLIRSCLHLLFLLLFLLIS